MTSLDILSHCSKQPLPSIIPASWCLLSYLISAPLNVGSLSDSLPTNRIWQNWWMTLLSLSYKQTVAFVSTVLWNIPHSLPFPTPLSLSLFLRLFFSLPDAVSKENPGSLWRSPRDEKPCE